MTIGIHSMTEQEALNVQLSSLGFDEVDFTNHLDSDSASWDIAGDLYNGGGAISITVSDGTSADLAAFFLGELTDAIQIIQPVGNRTMPGNWANGPAPYALDTWNTASNRLYTVGVQHDYFRLAATYAPMVAGKSYTLTIGAGVEQSFAGEWEITDYGGRSFSPAVEVTTKGTHTYTFTAPTGTSGGFRVKITSSAGNVTWWDNFGMTPEGVDEVLDGMVFAVEGTGDTTDDGLEGAKGSAPADGDLFAITGITTTGSELMPNVADRDFSVASAWTQETMNTYDETDDLTITATAADQYCKCPVLSVPMTAAEVYCLQCDVSGLVKTFDIKDFTGAQTFCTIEANGTGQTFQFKVAGGLTGGLRIVAVDSTSSATFDNFSLKVGLGVVTYLGNDVSSYSFSEDQTSTLTQTAANRASAGHNAKGRNLKEYALTYTITIKEAIAPANSLALTVTTFAGTATTMPVTAGDQTVVFLSASDADAANFVIQSVSENSAAGVLVIESLALSRCCDNGINPDGVKWWRVKAVEGQAVGVAGTSVTGDNASTQTILEGNNIEGVFSRVVGTSGIAHSYRIPHRTTDV